MNTLAAEIKKVKNIKESTIIKTLKINWDTEAKKILEIGKSFDIDFVIDKYNRDVFRQFLLYFTGNPNFNGSLNKGIMLVGDVGTGKSMIFDIFREYTKQNRINSFIPYYSLEIINNYKIEGAKIFEDFNYYRKNRTNYIASTCYIDDIASKNEIVNHYGTTTNVISDLISIRYIVFKKCKVLTHVTSNKYPEELKGDIEKEIPEIYDKRTRDRINEMFNFIEMRGNTRRK